MWSKGMQKFNFHWSFSLESNKTSRIWNPLLQVTKGKTMLILMLEYQSFTLWRLLILRWSIFLSDFFFNLFTYAYLRNKFLVWIHVFTWQSKTNTTDIIWVGINVHSLLLAENELQGKRFMIQQYPWQSIKKVSFNKRRFSIQSKPDHGVEKPPKLNYYTNSYRK